MMNFDGVKNFTHRRSPSSDRFLNIFSPTKPSAISATVTAADVEVFDELTESDVFWSGGGDSVETLNSPAFTRRKLGFQPPDKSGILAALPETTTQFRAIPRPQQSELKNSAAANRMGKSAPVNVPVAMRNPRKFSDFDSMISDDDDDDEMMLPPHEIVALKVKATSSVLEGVGRTLKGRDLRQVRNAVWNQTGFRD